MTCLMCRVFCQKLEKVRANEEVQRKPLRERQSRNHEATELMSWTVKKRETVYAQISSVTLALGKWLSGRKLAYHEPGVAAWRHTAHTRSDTHIHTPARYSKVLTTNRTNKQLAVSKGQLNSSPTGCQNYSPSESMGAVPHACPGAYKAGSHAIPILKMRKEKQRC